MKTLEENIQLYKQAQQLRQAVNAELHQQAKGVLACADHRSPKPTMDDLGSRSSRVKKTRSHKV